MGSLLYFSFERHKPFVVLKISATPGTPGWLIKHDPTKPFSFPIPFVKTLFASRRSLGFSSAPAAKTNFLALIIHFFLVISWASMLAICFPFSLTFIFVTVE